MEYHPIHLAQLVDIHSTMITVTLPIVIYHNSKYFNIISNSLYKTNDIIKLTINPFTSEITFHLNNKLISQESYNTLSTNQCKLAISLFHERDRVSIINKYNIIKQPKNKLEHRLSVSADIISDLIETILELKQQLSLIKHENLQLTFENQLLTKQNSNLTEYCLNECEYINVNANQVIQWY